MMFDDLLRFSEGLGPIGEGMPFEGLSAGRERSRRDRGDTSRFGLAGYVRSSLASLWSRSSIVGRYPLVSEALMGLEFSPDDAYMVALSLVSDGSNTRSFKRIVVKYRTGPLFTIETERRDATDVLVRAHEPGRFGTRLALEETLIGPVRGRTAVNLGRTIVWGVYDRS